MGRQRLVEENLLVGRDHGTHLVDLYAVGVLAVDDTDHAGGVLTELLVL